MWRYRWTFHHDFTCQSLEERGFTSWLLISRKSVDPTASPKNIRILVLSPLLSLLRSLWSASIFKELFLFLSNGTQIYSQNEIDAVVAFGGFTSLGPAMCMLDGRGFRSFLEANRAVGKAVRLISRYCRRVYLPEGMLLGGVQNG